MKSLRCHVTPVCAVLLLLQAASCSSKGLSGDGQEETETTGEDVEAGEDLLSDEDMLDPAQDESPPDQVRIVVQFGEALRPVLRQRLVELLDLASTMDVRVLGDHEEIPALPAGSMVFGFGGAPAARVLIAETDLSGVGPEGFLVRSSVIDGVQYFAADGNPPAVDRLGQGNLGAAYGSYALMERLGFAFLHPLDPTLPPSLDLPDADLDMAEEPAWPIRGFQIHTMHPLELTHLLQGWGPAGPEDEEGWRAMLPLWHLAMEWMIANRQNRVHWVLLEADDWSGFADSLERRQRLGELVDIAHAWGMAVGVDASIVLEQQHAFRLIRETGDLTQEINEMHFRIDWLMGAGFDYLASESGTSEFTHPTDDRMLAWMNEFAVYVDEEYDKPSYIKIHCSTGQHAETYVDPDTGEPLNFNFLPHYADGRLGVMPHTVQVYGLDDPAPTYGNRDFGYMREFLQEEVGLREVLWHPETAYWVSYDVDVPLFLPVYAERRLHDLRLLALDEVEGLMGRGEHAGGTMQGQLVFSSGWEWGYWLNDVVAARAAWNPHLEAGSDEDAFRRILEPLVRPFGEAAAALEDLLVRTADAQKDLLVAGIVDGTPPVDVVKRNGQAYLQGVETWDDISSLGASLGLPGINMTQPDKLGLVDMRNPFHGPPDYDEIEPLLAGMEDSFTALLAEYRALAPSVPEHARPLFDDMTDAMHMTALRAVQVHGLYDYVDGFLSMPMDWRLARLQAARDALDQALVVAAQREDHYRVDPELIAGWHPNPTVYSYGYLWTVRTLFFWWRDEGKAVDYPMSPCYLNIINPADVGFGEGMWADAVRVVRDIGESLPLLGSLAECLAEPAAEPVFPQDNLRDRP